MTGTAFIHWNNTNMEKETVDTGRFWEFKINQWVEKETRRDFTWEFFDYSPHNAKTNRVKDHANAL